jgi:hypothetical protein
MADGLSKINDNGVSAAIYGRLMEAVGPLADIAVETKQTSLHITHGRAFLGVHPRKDALLLNIVSNTPIDSSRAKKVERVSANRYHNEFLLTRPEEIDDELKEWINAAYAETQ